MVDRRYRAIFVVPLNEWQVVDIHGPEIVNSYHVSAEDRAREVADDMNRHDRKKRGLDDEAGTTPGQ